MVSKDPELEGFALLERSWRRVASTHTLQELLNADSPTVNRVDINMLALGVVLILSGMATVVGGVVCFGARFILPPSDNTFIEALREDRYYHILIPVMVPVTIAAVFFNWFSMKLFKHNS